jgi:RNA polymerase sigma-70 factor, ECF subfamily
MEFQDLYEPCERSLYYTALNILLNVEDAEDALQDTAYMAYKNFKRLRDYDFFKTWITRILINNCYKKFRKNRKSRENISLKDLDAVWFDDVNENESMILSALSVLNKKEKEVILLRYVNDLKLRDISIIMRISLNSVKSIHSRSLSKLKQHIEREEDNSYV